jgi:hypothetical protein
MLFCSYLAFAGLGYFVFLSGFNDALGFFASTSRTAAIGVSFGLVIGGFWGNACSRIGLIGVIAALATWIHGQAYMVYFGIFALENLWAGLFPMSAYWLSATVTSKILVRVIKLDRPIYR